MQPQQYCFIDDLTRFSFNSLDWCCDEADKAARKVADAIEILTEDANRIVDMSAESMSIVKTMQTKVQDAIKTDSSHSVIINLIKILEGITKEHADVETVINPIIEALQFQDRLSQNLKNLVKMLEFWLKYREKIAQKSSFNEELQLEFGQGMGALTTMPEERKILANHIPGLVFEEIKKDDLGLF